MVELIAILLLNNPKATVLVTLEPLVCNSEIECREVKAIADCYEDLTCRYGDYVLELEED
jgi:hypothetical protein